MNHGLTNTVLYAACKISVTFVHSFHGDEFTKRGTCFFVVNKHQEICLITNRHVVDASFRQQTPKYKDYRIKAVVIENHSLNHKTGVPDIVTQYPVVNIHDFRFSADAENDIACLSPITAAVEKAEIAYSIPYDLIADGKWINEKLTVCDFVGFPGFPDWYDKANNSPIFRTGTIASDPRFNYSNDEEYTGERIAYEAFSFGGSSGSPVFALQKGFTIGGAVQVDPGFFRPVKLIGINGGHLFKDDKQHSGISYLYKSSAILDIIDAEV